MRPIALGAILVVAASGWAQSLGDVARADRERVKPRAARVFTNDNMDGTVNEERPSRIITNDNVNTKVTQVPPVREIGPQPEAMIPISGKYQPLPAPSVAPPPPPLTPMERELDRMRVILRGICADPRTENGLKLSEIDKAAINQGIKPLRVRADEFQVSQKKYKAALAALDQEFEAKVVKTVNSGKALTDADLQRIRAMREEHDARRSLLLRQAESELQAFEAWQKELEAVGNECTEAANTVPD